LKTIVINFKNSSQSVSLLGNVEEVWKSIVGFRTCIAYRKAGIFYEIIRNELPKIDGTFDVVVLVFHKSVKDIPHEELKDTLVNTFKEADFYCNK